MDNDPPFTTPNSRDGSAITPQPHKTPAIDQNFLRLPNIGINIPDMGIYLNSNTTPNGLAAALFTTTQQRVLGMLYGSPHRSFTVSDLISSTGSGSGAVQRELAKLLTAGLLTLQPVGNQKRYQANASAPIYNELVGIIQKTVGLSGILRETLQPLAGEIHTAFIYGSVAKRNDTASSDIDLMIVSDTVGYADIMSVLDPAMSRLGRDINPTIYSRQELAKRRRSGNAFVTRILNQPKIWIIRDEDGLTT